MSGPIVRTGTTPEFWANYDRVFGNKGKKPKKQGTEAAEGAGSKKSAKKKSATVKAVDKKGAKKSAKKKSGKAGKK